MFYGCVNTGLGVSDLIDLNGLLGIFEACVWVYSACVWVWVLWICRLVSMLVSFGSLCIDVFCEMGFGSISGEGLNSFVSLVQYGTSGVVVEHDVR